VRTTPERDAELDEVFAAAGYDVVAPETLPLDDQLELVATAGELAGLTGSALHLAAFAPGTTRVLEIGDERTRDAGHPTQLALDAARGRERAFVPHAVPGPALAELLRPDH
jgi:capsular polysaccharide biosynthesis protein